MINIQYKSLNDELPKDGREIQYIITENGGLNIFGALGHLGDFSVGVVRYSLVTEEGECFDVEPEEDYTPGKTYMIDGETYTCEVYLGKEEALGDELIYPNRYISLYWCDVAETLMEFFDEPLIHYIKEGVEDGVMKLEVTSKKEYIIQDEVLWHYEGDLIYKNEVHKLWAFGLEHDDPVTLSWHHAGGDL